MFHKLTRCLLAPLTERRYQELSVADTESMERTQIPGACAEILEPANVRCSVDCTPHSVDKCRRGIKAVVVLGKRNLDFEAGKIYRFHTR